LLICVRSRTDRERGQEFNFSGAVAVRVECRAMAQLKHNATFEELLADEARRFKQAAEEQPPGSTARASLLRRARQAETASHLKEWLGSPGLQPPK